MHGLSLLKQLPIQTLINLYGIKRRMTVSIRYREIYPIGGTCPEKTVLRRGSPYEETPYFLSGGLRNFYINLTSQKASKDEKMKGHNASISERSLIASIEVRTRLRTEHLASKDVLTKNEISYDMEKQDNEFGMSKMESIIGNQLFMSTSCSNRHGKYVRDIKQMRWCVIL